ncbi:integrase arm-type DNA-binding domain-containing protein [Bradyrhizobium sp. 139]|uniref:tyrosine-type recombinase/integrase n=1 Tax=Bradyrhizobium sp. 139 TaxID=2782616 RepID=UPI001FFC0E7A|nr:integrase arm-type DNA-binding domain-containing protein [Bradyrhizobium sp. 139]MCK1744479.1 integrase arm-type DNA-binding domain-containing protein [Bradyrhizobium sp. 139]
MALTLFALQNAKPKSKPYKLSDGEGLHLLIQPNGSKWWRFRYQFSGKEKMLSLGTFPEVSLAAAREKRRDARKLVADDIDPSLHRKEEKIAATVAASNTFGLLVEEHIKNLEEGGAAPSTLDKNRWLLQDLAAPLTKRPITDVTPAEILDILKKVEKSGRRDTARRLRGAIGTAFRLAIQTLRATNDPTFALRGSLLKPNVQHRPAITDERELGALMVSIDEYDG